MPIASSERIISARELAFAYNPQSQARIHALGGIDLDVHPGEYLVAINRSDPSKSATAIDASASQLWRSPCVVISGCTTRTGCGRLDDPGWTGTRRHRAHQTGVLSKRPDGHWLPAL